MTIKNRSCSKILGSVVPPNCHERSTLKTDSSRRQSFPGTVRNHADRTNRLLKVPSKKNHFSNVTLVLVAKKEKNKNKKNLLYTNHMYPSSVVSSVKLQSKHPSRCFYTKHKNRLKKTKQYFSLPFHTPLICSVWRMSLPVTGWGGYGYIHIYTHVLLNECDDPLV